MLRDELKPDLVLVNANVIAFGNQRTVADAVAVREGRITWVGRLENLPAFASLAVGQIDCQQGGLLPGFVDAHCHIFGLIAKRLSVDCGPPSVRSIADIKRRIGERARVTPAGQWIRAQGYDEFHLREKRHPTRHDLDSACPDHPLRLTHRSGHAIVFNSRGLSEVGINTDTPDPVGGVIDRFPETGCPTGLLFEMNDYLEGRVPQIDADEFLQGARQTGKELLRLGVTSAQDASPTNTLDRWETFRKITSEPDFGPRVTMMVRVDQVGEFAKSGLTPGYGDGNLRVGHAKIMVTGTTGAMTPDPESLSELVARCHAAGFGVAIHAVETEAVDAAIGAIASNKTISHKDARLLPDRVEHCSECPPHLMRRLKDSGAMVVTQPGFIHHSGDRYLADVPKEMQPSLYPVASWRRAGVRVAFSSDAPVIDPDPLVGVRAAVTRTTRSGKSLGTDEAVSILDALEMYTRGGARAAGQERDLGSIATGMIADMVLLDKDPKTPDALANTRVAMTIRGGQVVWEA